MLTPTRSPWNAAGSLFNDSRLYDIGEDTGLTTILHQHMHTLGREASLHSLTRTDAPSTRIAGQSLLVQTNTQPSSAIAHKQDNRHTVYYIQASNTLGDLFIIYQPLFRWTSLTACQSAMAHSFSRLIAASSAKRDNALVS